MENWRMSGMRCIEEIRGDRVAAYLEAAQRLSGTGFFGWNVATGELFWSAESLHILGYESTPTLDQLFERIHPEDQSLVREALELARERESSLEPEHRFLMPDGTVKHLQIRARPTRTSTGDLEFVGALLDVSERKRMNLELALAKAQKAEAFLAQAQRLSQTGSFSWHVATGELFWSDEMYSIYGFDRSTELTVETVNHRVQPDDS